MGQEVSQCVEDMTSNFTDITENASKEDGEVAAGYLVSLPEPVPRVAIPLLLDSPSNTHEVSQAEADPHEESVVCLERVAGVVSVHLQGSSGLQPYCGDSALARISPDQGTRGQSLPLPDPPQLSRNKAPIF